MVVVVVVVAVTTTMMVVGLRKKKKRRTSKSGTEEEEEDNKDGNEWNQHAVNAEEKELHASVFDNDKDTVDDENDDVILRIEMMLQCYAVFEDCPCSCRQRFFFFFYSCRRRKQNRNHRSSSIVGRHTGSGLL